MTRREALGAVGAAAAFAGGAYPQAAAERNGGPKIGQEQGPRSAPLVCAYSANLAKVFYPQLGVIAQQIGYDAVDLTVMEGGHVNPHATNVDLVRAIESVRGAGLEVPMIATTITSVAEPTAYPILAITGRTGVHLYRTGFWPWGGAPNPQRRLAEVRSDLANLAGMGRQSEMVAMISNRATAGGESFVGGVLWDIQQIVADLDPSLIGYCFDPSQTQNWETALRLALPRLKAAAVQDFFWEKTGNSWAMKMCPLGEGMVDWALFFRMLAQARFTGPLSIHSDYAAPDPLAAMTKDLEFVRKQIRQAWALS